MIIIIKREMGCYYTTEVSKSMSGIQEIPRYLLVLSCSVIKVMRKLLQPNPSKPTNGPEPSGVKLWVTLPGKESQPAEVLAEDKGI